MKQSLREELSQIEKAQGREGRWPFIAEALNDKDQSSQAHLRRLILAITALNDHVKENYLSHREIKRLVALGQTLLRVEGIRPKSSRLSFLHWELHYLQSRIYFQRGDFLVSDWEHQLSLHLSQASGDENIGFKHLTSAEIYLGLGYIVPALEELHKARELCKNQNHRVKIAILQIRCLRFTGQRVQVEETIKSLQTQFPGQTKLEMELQWEKACFQESTRISSLLLLCKKGKSHYKAGYLLELFFWIHAQPDPHYHHRIGKLSTLVRKKELDFSPYRLFLSFALDIEKAWDADIPFTVRFQALQKIVSEHLMLRDLDKKALALLAVVRWLVKSRQKDLARSIYFEYEALSQKITGGVSVDFLKTAADLPAKLGSAFSNRTQD